MTDQRFIIEMGMGTSLHRGDYQQAAERAVEDALRHSTIPLFKSLNIPHTQMRVQVTVGVAEPEKIDTDKLADYLPRGRATVTAVKGGHNVVNSEIGETNIIATAAVEAFLPKNPHK